MISIFDYTSYKDFISDYYKEQKQLNPKFSYQYFADKAGFRTKTFIPKVISGEKKLAQRSTHMITKAMELNKREEKYFIALVNFNNSKNIDEKEYQFYQLQSLGKKSKKFQTLKNEFDYFSKWYHVVIYELLAFYDWKNDYKILAKAVDPPITEVQARKAVTLLKELGLIKKGSSGKYVHCKSIVISDELRELAFKKFHKQVLELGQNALFKGIENQELTTITNRVSIKALSLIKAEMKNLQIKIAEIIDEDQVPTNGVFHLNLQLFPVSKTEKEKK